jgi:hypothetical protein
MSEQFPTTAEMFPTAAHISKMIKSFAEVMPGESAEDYSFLSEFSHPNSFALGQHYEWPTPYEISFTRQTKASGMFGATTAACINGVDAIRQLLVLTGEQSTAKALYQLLMDLVEQENKAE